MTLPILFVSIIVDLYIIKTINYVYYCINILNFCLKVKVLFSSLPYINGLHCLLLIL